MVRKIFIHFLFVYSIFLILSGCASSTVSRQAAANMDRGIENARGFTDSDTEFADTYQNLTQATRGAILGGTAGAVTGAFSGIGVIPGTVTGTLLGASYGSYIDSQTNVKDQLENRGAIIVVLGDQILIVLPSERIFQSSCTTSIKSQAYSTLALVSQYINSYTKMLVKVAGYTSASGSSQRDLLLSQRQAQKVARALLATGIDARVLFAEGYGGTHLVEQNSIEGDSDNNRIEITLEKLYV